MKKRILFISYYFAPQNAIGAIRPTKLAKYLARMGHEVTVLCGAGMLGTTDPTLQRDLQDLSDVHVITEWNPLRDLKAKKAARAAQGGSEQPKPTAPVAAAPSKRGLAARAADALYVYLRWLSDCSFYRRALKELKTLPGGYDAVFSSYAPFSVHRLAQAAKRRGLAKRWIADFRDEVGMPFAWQRGKQARYMRMLRREADILSAVSHGVLDMMHLETAGRVLPNGFDREDLPPAREKERTDELRVVYCGTIEMGRKNVPPRDLTPMFRALRALVDEGALCAEKLRLVYAGGEGALFRAYAQQCGLGDCVEEHGYVSREKSIELQRGADILLMASWHMAAQKGILTGKLFEYLMMDKPIVCCMSGDLPESGVKRILEATGMGLCVEQANAQQDEAELLAWLRGALVRLNADRPLLEAPNPEAVEAYHYPALAQELDRWISEPNHI